MSEDAPTRIGAAVAQGRTDQVAAAGLDRMHGLRHAYAIDRHRELTGWEAPAPGGPTRGELTGGSARIDRAARERISRELGHERLEVVRLHWG